MPKLICTECTEQVRKSYIFQNSCEINTQQLHDILNNQFEEEINDVFDDNIEDSKIEYADDPFNQDPIIELITPDRLEVEAKSTDNDNSRKRFKCKICEMKFQNKSQLANHATLHNQICKSLKLEPFEYIDEETNERKYQCLNCGTGISEKKQFPRHFKLHPCKCPDGNNCCPGETKSKNLELCKCIDFTTITLSSYQESLKFQKFLCPNCFRLFNDHKDLRVHLKNHDCVCAIRSIPVDQNPAKCCKFEVNVTEKDNYRCTNCNQEFVLIASVIEHLKQHECVCDNTLCGETTSNSKLVYKYQCPKCPKLCSSIHHLIGHQLIQHRNECSHIIKEPLEVKDEPTGGFCFVKIIIKLLANVISQIPTRQ